MAKYLIVERWRKDDEIVSIYEPNSKELKEIRDFLQEQRKEYANRMTHASAMLHTIDNMETK